jgi:hypothetical protein
MKNEMDKKGDQISVKLKMTRRSPEMETEAEDFGAAFGWIDEWGEIETGKQVIQRHRLWNAMVKTLRGTSAAHLVKRVPMYDLCALYTA